MTRHGTVFFGNYRIIHVNDAISAKEAFRLPPVAVKRRVVGSVTQPSPIVLWVIK